MAQDAVEKTQLSGGITRFEAETGRPARGERRLSAMSERYLTLFEVPPVGGTREVRRFAEALDAMTVRVRDVLRLPRHRPTLSITQSFEASGTLPGEAPPS